MAINKSKENSRIADFLALSDDDRFIAIATGIDNPSILAQFIADEAATSDAEESEEETEATEFNYGYAVAAGILDWDDVAWIKKQEEEEEEEEEDME